MTARSTDRDLVERRVIVVQALGDRGPGAGGEDGHGGQERAAAEGTHGGFLGHTRGVVPGWCVGGEGGEAKPTGWWVEGG